MTHLARRAAAMSTAVLAGPPLILSVAFGLAVHHHRTRRTHR